jgi:hypothetical protein
VPVEGGTGRAVVSPAASTLRDEMAVSGQRLLAASGQIPMAAHTKVFCGVWDREHVVDLSGASERTSASRSALCRP